DKYTIDLASDGVEAVEACRSQEYDLILMDFFMPNMDGVEATREIRRFRPKQRVIGLTGNCLDEDQQKFIQVVFVSYHVL
ncbi:unnamed protein product, partial [Heterosigma akashiwo]